MRAAKKHYLKNGRLTLGNGEESNIKSGRLIYFSPMSHFYTPWKRQKTYGFLTFLGGIEMWHWTKMG